MKQLLLLAAFVALSSPALAQSDAEATAKALDSEGARLRNADKPFAEYCEKFHASEALAPTVPRKFEAGTCLEKEGKMASAFAKYKEALQLADTARRANPDDQIANRQYAAAQQRMNDLEPKLSKLTVSVTQKVPGLVVKRGQETVLDAIYGIGLPIDPGSYEVTAQAPGYKPFTITVTVNASDAQTVTIPALEACTGGACGSAPGACSDSEVASNGKCECKPTLARNTQGLCVAASSSTGGGGGIPVLTWVFGGAGVLSLGATGILSVIASNKFSSSKNPGNGCDAGSQTCVAGSTGAQMQRDAHTDATIGTVTFIAGLALIGTGVVILAVGGGGKNEGPKTSLMIQPGGLSLIGSF